MMHMCPSLKLNWLSFVRNWYVTHLLLVFMISSFFFSPIFIGHILLALQVMDLDRRVKRGRERLAQEVEPAPAPPLSAEKSEQLSVLEEKIKNLLEQVETLGEAGKVDEAEALMRKVLLLYPEFF